MKRIRRPEGQIPWKVLIASIVLLLISSTFLGCGNNANSDDQENIEYTFIKQDPDFGSEKVTQYDFDEISIIIPDDWLDERDAFLGIFQQISKTFDDEMLLIGSVYPNIMSLNSNVTILKQPGVASYDLEYFATIYPEQVQEANEKQLNVDIELNDVLYADLGTYDAAVIYMDTVYNQMSIEWIIVVVPTEQNYYYEVTFTIINGIEEDVIPEIVQSIQTYK